MNKKYLILFFILYFCFNKSGFSQQIPLPLSDYKFINAEKNKIEVPNDSTSLSRFFAKVDTFYQECRGNINILHIGGSHVQAGVFSNQIRENLDFLNNRSQTSRGLIFPFKAAKTNNPPSYSVSYKGEWAAQKNVMRDFLTPLGVTGIAVITSDSTAEISVNLNPQSEKRWFMDTLILIGYAENDKVVPVLKQNDTTHIWATYDAENSTYTYILPEKTDNFTIIFHQTESSQHQFVLKGFIPKSGTQGIVYHEIGVNGAAVLSYLKCTNFEKELSLIKPDMVIFGIGINDAADRNFSSEKFIDNYNALIARIRKVSPDCAFIFITNNDSYRKVRVRRRRFGYEVNRNGLTAQRAFYEIASQNSGGVWDQFEIMGGLRSMQKWQDAGLAKKDKIHFTNNGYSLLGNLFYNAFAEYYLEHYTSLRYKQNLTSTQASL
jgi:hypothetical protein